jgi:hypothetical protein
MHQLKEVDMLSTKMDLLMKRLDDQAGDKREVKHIHDAYMTCEECGGTGHSYPEIQEDVNYVSNNNNYHPQNQTWSQNQNQNWNQQQRLNYHGNYSGNYQGNNFNTPLRDLVSSQTKLLDQISKKLVSNDKLLETINNRMDGFASAIKNQLSFNKMLESQIAQLASSITLANEGKIPGQPEELETTNLVDIFNASWYHTDKQTRGWKDDSMLEKKGDSGRPVIPIAIGQDVFEEAICDFGKRQHHA